MRPAFLIVFSPFLLLSLLLQHTAAQTFVNDPSQTDADQLDAAFLSSGHLTSVEQFSSEVTEAEYAALNRVVEFLESADPALLQRRAANLLAERRDMTARAAGPLELISETPLRWIGDPVYVAGRLEDRQTYTLSQDTTESQRRTRLRLDVPWSDLDVVVDLPASEDIASGAPLETLGIFFKVLEEADGTRAVMVVSGSVDVVGADARDDCASVVHRRPLRPDESAAYYRTLQRARLVPHNTLAQRAAELRRQRIAQRADEQPQRYGKYREDSDRFPTFVDIFQHTEEYTCQPVTLRGRVREVLEYPADENRYALGTLYEVRLFPDDGQRNPAIIVCTELPEDFPRDAGVVDGVSVTGYFFKMYAYRAEDPERSGGELTRIAPMILASHIEWTGEDGNRASGVPSGFLIAFACLVFAIPLLYLVRAVVRERASQPVAREHDLPDRLELPDDSAADDSGRS